jgi:ATP phosphoribosyltransferase
VFNNLYGFFILKLKETVIMLRIAVTKGRIEEEFVGLLNRAGLDSGSICNKGRRLLVKSEDDIEFIFSKSNDTLRFVDLDIVDLAVVGKDAIIENDSEIYNELLDLKIGKCYFALAGVSYFKTANVIASKYPNVARKFFAKKSEYPKILKIESSAELAPILNIADGIVDIVQSGDTLKANGLNVIEKICDISTVLVGNSNSIGLKSLNNFTEKLRKYVC